MCVSHGSSSTDCSSTKVVVKEGRVATFQLAANGIVANPKEEYIVKGTYVVQLVIIKIKSTL